MSEPEVAQPGDPGMNALIEDRDRLSLALEALELGTWEVDLRDAVVTADERTCAMFGFTTAPRRIEDWIAALHPEDRDRAAAGIQRAIGNRSRYEAEYRVIGPGGATRWILAKAVPVSGLGGRAARLAGVAQDITPRREAEERNRDLLRTAQEERDRLSALIASIDDEVWFADANAKFTLANSSALREFNLAGAGEMKVETLAASVEVFRADGTPRPVDEAPPLRALRGEIVRNQEEIVRAAGTGQLRYREVSSAPVRDAAGHTIGAVSVVRDITARKQAEQELKNQREWLRVTLGSIGDAVLATDAEGKVTFLNAVAENLTGWTREEAAGKPAADVFRVVNELTREPAENIIRRVLAEKRVLPLANHTALISRDGRETPIEDSAAPIQDEHGTVLGVVLVFHDVTEKRRAEDALRNRDKQLTQILDGSPGIVFVKDLEGRFIITNTALERLLGIGREELKGKTDYDLFPKDKADYYRQHDRAVAGSGAPAQIEEVVEPAGGPQHTFLANKFPLRDAEGRVYAVCGISTEITEWKQSEERLRQAQKLESVGLLAGGIAHDFNNLLTGIMGNASMLLDDIGEDALAGLFREVIKSAERAAHLTRQLLAYSGKGQFIVRDIDISQAVTDMADLVQMSLPKSVDLAIAVQRRLPPVRMDPGHLQQILMNLAINAGEAIGDATPGKITVATSLFEVQRAIVDALGAEVQPGRYVCIEVADTGTGIEEDQRSKIFDPFFSTKFTGRGLGLAAVAGILRSQKGGILVESAPGRGSTFRVLLPAARHTSPEPRSQAGGRGTVLIVDDDETVRHFIGAALGRQGYRVLLASDGQEALECCERQDGNIKAIVLDVVMPAMGANEFLPVLRSRYSHIRILLTSGFSECEAKRLCAIHPGTSFIQKPYTARQIVKAVEELLAR